MVPVGKTAETARVGLVVCGWVGFAVRRTMAPAPIATRRINNANVNRRIREDFTGLIPMIIVFRQIDVQPG